LAIAANEPSPYPSPRGRGNEKGKGKGNGNGNGNGKGSKRRLLKEIDGGTPGRVFKGTQEVEE
jgi:hypothetical protein